LDAIFLKPGREKSLRLRHPWIFSGAIDRVRGVPQPGDTVDVLSSAGEWLCRAAYSPLSNIRARVWTFDAETRVDAVLIHKRLESALALRSALVPESETDALRLVHGESDGLPGVIVDRYAGWLVIQCLTAGADMWKDTIIDALVELTGITQVYERSDVDVRHLEGLPERVGMVRGEAAPEEVTIVENGLKFAVDLRSGQKTGFYLDQRLNRRRLGQLSAGRDILNCFSYTGAFSAYALAGGARSVLSVDSSSEVLKTGAQNIQVLRKLRDQGRSFDLVVLDPPKFAPTVAQVEQATRGYKDINLLALKLLRPGGLLFTFSCSGGVSADLFQKIVAGAALDARVDARIVEHLSQGVDHPVALNFPEGTYLKGLILARM